ncbi:GIY-YIG nuclease family protein [Schumannella luteola]|nr:GIY-YIG nuclease family protein [Schumannella luteola]
MREQGAGPGCCAPDCGDTADPDALVPLCPHHLALAVDGATSGIEDALPAPCVACGSRLGVRYPSGWLCAVCEWRHGELPDDLGERGGRPLRVDVVYYLRVADRGHSGDGDRFKIGTSGNLGQRMQQLWHDELVAIERGDRHRERARHAQFAATRYGTTEWFARSDELDAHLAALSAGVDDPWLLHARWRSEALALRG